MACMLCKVLRVQRGGQLSAIPSDSHHLLFLGFSYSSRCRIGGEEFREGGISENYSLFVPMEIYLGSNLLIGN